jgi:hypothetical protein
MKQYEVVLTRSYIVTIQTENEAQALRSTEFYLGDCPDLSKSRDRSKQKLKIEKIEMTFN